MNIVVDENIPRPTVDALGARGHRIVDVRGTPIMGATDEALWTIAQRDHALIISTDKGFMRRCRQPHWGVLVIRLRQPNWAKIHARAIKAMDSFSDWRNLLVVMRDHVQSVWRFEQDPDT